MHARRINHEPRDDKLIIIAQTMDNNVGASMVLQHTHSPLSHRSAHHRDGAEYQRCTSAFPASLCIDLASIRQQFARSMMLTYDASNSAAAGAFQWRAVVAPPELALIVSDYIVCAQEPPQPCVYARVRGDGQTKPKITVAVITCYGADGIVFDLAWRCTDADRARLATDLGGAPADYVWMCVTYVDGCLEGATSFSSDAAFLDVVTSTTPPVDLDATNMKAMIRNASQCIATR